MTIQELKTWLEAQNWTFAKTMPKNPHYWIAKQDFANKDEFVEAARTLRREGIPEMYFNRSYQCLYFNGWKYWPMGYTAEDCTIINRKKVE